MAARHMDFPADHTVIRALLISFLTGWWIAVTPVSGAEVHIIRVEGVINPVSSDYIKSHIEQAEDENAMCLIIELDTPGGLMTSMRDITKGILGARVPVVVYVSPTGSRAASAGVFITLSAHIAAMAPSTNIGAAHPVNLGGGGFGGGADSSLVMEEKVVNDAVAQIKAIAEKFGRNAEWAEKAVRESVSITETEALEMNVIDLVAPSIDSLLAAIDGWNVFLEGGSSVTLDTKDVEQRFMPMGWRYELLKTISDPNVAYILMMLGTYGLLFEIYSPGAIYPGVIGAFCLILAFFAFQTLPISFAGMLLIALGFVLLLLEVYVISYGLLTVAATAAIILGSIMLVDSPIPAMQVSLSVILPTVIATVAFFLLAMGMALKAQRRKVVTGQEGMIGLEGTVDSAIDPVGTIKVHGELWKARSAQSIPARTQVRVVKVMNLELEVVTIAATE